MVMCGIHKVHHNTVADVRECYEMRAAERADEIAAFEDAAAAERRAELIHESPALVNMAYADELEHERLAELNDEGLQRMRAEREAYEAHERNLASWGKPTPYRPMTLREEDELEYRIERAEEAAEWYAEDYLAARGL